ncbi:hypothetical protein R1flu_020007 [Riccia fluitans]|uniref:Protein Asterix n=1 Tax=Riccia fluitans TaxID=41844 RepID=A0ABD1ZNS6_9MARC
MSDKADPRQPAAAKPYVHPVMNPVDLPPDYPSLLAVMCGVIGVMLRNKIGSWFALIFCLQSFINMKNVETDLKQVVMAFTFAVMGMITNYLGPGSKAAATQTGG